MDNSCLNFGEITRQKEYNLRIDALAFYLKEYADKLQIVGMEIVSMDEYSFDAFQGRKGNRRSSKSWLVLGSRILAIVIMFVLFDFSDLRGKMVKCLSSRPENGTQINDSEKIALSENEGTDQEKDIVVTEKDLQKVYRELLQKKEKEIEKLTILESEKGTIYQVDLVTGKSLTAVTIQMDKKTAMITDRQGMVMSIGREEITGIKKIDLNTTGRQGK